MLTNGQAGLIDLDLVKTETTGSLCRSLCFERLFRFTFTGKPTEGQSLDEVKNLLLQEIDKLRKGEFSDDLIQSIVNNEKKGIIQKDEKYSSRASILMDEFTSEVDHKASLEYVDEISKLTKKDIMDFVSKYLQNNNYVAVYKRKGEDKSIVKVDKPTITPVSVNREDQSPFLKKIDEMPENPIAPVWLNYDKDIAKNKLADVEVLSVKILIMLYSECIITLIQENGTTKSFHWPRNIFSI